MTWDDRFIGLARHVSTWSKDRSRKVAAVIVSSNNSILGIGYNGFPRGVDDDVEERHQRPAKYKWTEHAERNAIYNAARNGVRIDGARMYLPWYPCMDCARSIVQAGIAELICVEPDWNDKYWHLDFADSPTMLKEGRVSVRFI